MKIRDIISAIEAFAPPSLQESYDNTGYQTGNPDAEASGALLCIDVTEGIIDEAMAKGCNLVITHHPLLFRGVKCVIGRDRPRTRIGKSHPQRHHGVFLTHSHGLGCGRGFMENGR